MTTGIETRHDLDAQGLTPADTTRGLSDAEAAARLEAGLGNGVPEVASRTYTRILLDNAFTPINLIIFGIGGALLLMGLYLDALATVGLVLLNVVVGVTQEGRAKRQLDRIALLARPTARVRRDGREVAVDPALVVLGDVVLIGAGDQIVADGRLVADGRVEIDESLLSGESEPVPHRAGDRVAAGSFCVAGSGAYVVAGSGADALANRLVASARAYRQRRTPIQREIDLVLRVMVVAVLAVAGPVAVDLTIRALSLLTDAVGGPFSNTLARAYQNYSLEEAVRSTAVVVGLVPQGLLMMLTVAYTVGAVRLAGSGALMQGANAVESLSHVSVLCLDKTGTLTTNRLVLAEAHPLAADEPTLRRSLAMVATGATARNRTLQAIAVALPPVHAPLVGEIPFTSARRWSATAFAGGDLAGVYLFGAPEALLPALAGEHDVAGPLAAATARGLRVLLLARGPDDARLDPDAPVLPTPLTPLGLVMLADEIQAGAAETLARFRAAGVRPIVISGDHPDTVAALARQAGFGADGELRALSGAEIAAMDPAVLAREVERTDVFGRIGPEQKVAIVHALQANGHWVAMTGDGVNDVLAVKAAQVGIAMQGGSQATRAVADLVLLGDSFAALPPAFVEGQRIVRGAQALIELYLARSLAMIVGAAVVGGAFPVTPRTSSLPALLGAGIPTILLMSLIRPGRARQASLRDLAAFSLTAALTIAPVGLTLYLGYLRATGDVALARSALSVFLTLCTLAAMAFVEPPTRFWVARYPLAGEWRLGAMIAALAGLLVAALAWPWLRSAFELVALGPLDLAVIALAGGVWVFAVRTVWRRAYWRRIFASAGGDSGQSAAPPR